MQILDVLFRLRGTTNTIRAENRLDFATMPNPNISPDILIVGVELSTLNRYGQWPFPRRVHANLLNSFTRISDFKQRENAVFFDFFFTEPDRNTYNDSRMLDSIIDNNRVFLETIVRKDPVPLASDTEIFARQEELDKRQGQFTRIFGNWFSLPPNYGVEPPLLPLAKATAGYGHANFYEDRDKIFRRQPIIIRLSKFITNIRLRDLEPHYPVNIDNLERLVWFDRKGVEHNIHMPLTEQRIQTLRNTMEIDAQKHIIESDFEDDQSDTAYIINHYQDQLIPSITLSLALNYFNVPIENVEIAIGQYVKIPYPRRFDPSTGTWGPYTLEIEPAIYDVNGSITSVAKYKKISEIVIPIDHNGDMLINFMGLRSSETRDGFQTYPVRPYQGYSSRVPPKNPDEWPKTKALSNKIVMVGAFSHGLADDEKITPMGLMYGVEIHANALNTIIMDNFILTTPRWLDMILIIAIGLGITLIIKRLPIFLASLCIFVVFIILCLGSIMIFYQNNIRLSLGSYIIIIAITYISLISLRLFNEEREKRHIRSTFVKYVSPVVVDQVLRHPPELGGSDNNLTVFFSDIRGFTSLSERIPAKELIDQLNMYFTAMTKLIFEYQGTLDKYVGDEIMCFWGAPIYQEDHALRACRCALKQIKKLAELNNSWPEERRLNVGIGINSGMMTVGNVGSSGHLNYTLIGDNVNLGSRLEGTNKHYGTNIILSEHTYNSIRPHAIVRELDVIQVKGKNKPVLIYELIAVNDATL